MVLRDQTDMPCCYQHKTLNITVNGTKTALKSGRSKAKLNVRLDRPLGRVRECQKTKQKTTLGGQSTKAYQNEMKGSGTDKMENLRD